jgi:hypothetical protein
MKIKVDEKGQVFVAYEPHNPELISELIQKVKEKHGIKNLVEVSKLFGLSPSSGKRSVVGWCADSDKKTSLVMPQNQFELLNLIANGDIPIESVSKVGHRKSPKGKEQILKVVCNHFDLKSEYIDLLKFEGEYYWAGKLSFFLNNTRTPFAQFSDQPIERWLEDLSIKIEESNLSGCNVNELIEAGGGMDER